MANNKRNETKIKVISGQPAVYTINLHDSSADELNEVYSNQILIAASIGDIEKAMIEYTNNVVEPVGWNAVWRATTSTTGLDVECDFLVEVLDVSMHKLESTIKILGIFDSADLSTIQESPDYQLMEQLEEGVRTVPLIELYPMSEDDSEGFFLKTAVAIEYIRFFYRNIWRPWDEEDDDDVIFSEKHLTPRLKFYFDIHSGVVSETMARKAETLLQQGNAIRDKLNNLHSSMALSDSESEFDEVDMVQSIQLRMELEDLQRQIEMLENPLVRNLVLGVENLNTTKPHERSYRVLHLVGHITLGNIKTLPWDSNVVVKMYDTPDKAILNALSGETILIYPGVYKCLSLGWIEESITVQGVGKPEDVILKGSKGGGDIYLNCQASELTLENLTFKPDRSMKTTILLHKGRLDIKNCIINGSDCCILILDGAYLNLDSCQVLFANVDGVNMRLGSSLMMKSSTVHHCQGSGLRVDGESETSFGGPPEEIKGKINQVSVINLDKAQFHSNRHYGIIVDYKEDHELENDELDMNILRTLPWLELKVDEQTNEIELFCTGSDHTNNGKGNIGIHCISNTLNKQSIVVSSPPPYHKFLDSISRGKFLSISSEGDIVGDDKNPNWSTVVSAGDVFSFHSDSTPEI